jgi:hypothetical protein
MGKDYIEPGIRIEAEYNGTTYSTVSEIYGSYRLYVPGSGKVKFTLYMKNILPPPTAIIYSFDRPARYDFVLEGNDLKMK